MLNDQAANLSALAYDPAADLLADIDGLRVLAPGWKQSHNVPGGVKELAGDTLIPQIKACGDNVLTLTRGATERDHAALVRGWSTPEEIGVWTAASVAELAVRFPYPVPGASILYSTSGPTCHPPFGDSTSGFRLMGNQLMNGSLQRQSPERDA